LYIGSYDGNVYAMGTSTALIATATPIPQPTSTPSPAPTAIPTPTPTSQPTTTPTQTPMSIQEPVLLSETQPTNQTIGVASNRNEPINWIILGTIVAMTGIAILTLYAVFKRDN
jgi:hypothetical protein